jgi:hypothetical protein
VTPADPTQRQIEYLGGVLTQLEDKMIDPREFGRLEGAVEAVKAELDAVKSQQAAINAKLDQVLDKLSEAKGGWKLLMALGGAAATLGGVITWFATHTVTVGPKG